MNGFVEYNSFHTTTRLRSKNLMSGCTCRPIYTRRHGSGSDSSSVLCGRKHDNKMKIIQLQFYVLICCQAAVSDLLTDLGSNVIINCDLDENEVYWILLKTPDPPTLILRSLYNIEQITPIPPFYYNKTFRNKYSVQFKHRLVINNVTADELGVYYCMNTRTPPKLSNSTRIYFTEQFNQTECHNHTVLQIIDQNQTQWKIISIISALMNGLLIIVVIGLLKCSAEQSRLEADQQQTQDTEQHQEHLHFKTCESSLITKINFCLDNY